MKWVKSFPQISKSDAGIAGGKGASLGEMTRAGISVPPGFVILADAFERFLEEADLNQELDTILHSVKHEEIHTVEAASEKIKALILAAKMPQDIADEIESEFKKLDAEFVAVRSSATAEDGAAAAWAGQLDTFLNTTESKLLENVQRCWASLFTPRAIFYRFEKGMHGQKISVAVVVQKMVQSEVSGIAFSVHPVTEDYNQLIIEAGFGLGEAIVSGQVTPDSYVVEKNPRRIIDTNISTQTRALYRGGEEGNEWKDIPEPKASSQVLSEEQILELADLILKIEAHYGFPCDIEWAFEEGKFYITQSRPITTLSPTTAYLPSDTNRTISDIKKIDWYQDWSGLYSQLEASLDTDAYFGIFEKTCGVRFSQAFITFKGETAIGWLSTEDAERVGTHLVGRMKDPAFLVDWAKAFRQHADTLMPFFNLSQEDFLSRFREYKELYPQLAPYVIGTKIAFNMLPIGAEKIAVELEAARAYTERFYKDSSVAITALCEFIAERSGCSVGLTRTLTTDDVCAYADAGKLPKKAILEKRAASGGMLFTPDSRQALSKAEVEEVFSSFRPTTTDGVLRGTSAYSGNVKGACRIVLDYRNAVLNEGEILVTPMTNPYFVPLMKKAAAIVTDGGGMLSHAAIVARELKKPCIIGTKIATQVLKDGDMVEVDAEKGIVRIL